MRRALVLAILLVLSSAATALAETELRCTIDGPQAGTDSLGGGFGRFTLLDDDRLEYYIEYWDLTQFEIAAHLHGPPLPGNLGGTRIELPLGTPKSGTTPPLDPILRADLLRGDMYVLIHGSSDPLGEIRGQIIPIEPEVATDEESWSAVKADY